MATSTFNIKDQKLLFDKLLEPELAEQLSNLLATGQVTAGFGFFSVSLSFTDSGKQPQQLAATLPKSVTAILSGKVLGPELEVCKSPMTELAKQVINSIAPGSVAATPTTDMGTVEEDPAPPKPKVVKPKPATPFPSQPTSGVIKLANATALGQKTAGTSPGSVYYCVALSERVKIAMRYKSGSGELSIRAEGALMTTPQVAALKAAGMSQSDSYWSMHMSVGDVPVGRVIGAFLMGLGIEFDQTINNANQLKAEA